MIASDEMEQFLREGLHRYPGAREVIETFEREMQDRLVHAFERKEDWRNFVPLRGDRGRGKALVADKWRGSEGCGVWSKQSSASETGGSVELGLWWQSPRAKAGVIAYCNFHDADGRRQPVQLANPKARVICGPVDGGKARLYVVIEGVEATLDETFTLLLDEIDRSLAHGAKPQP